MKVFPAIDILGGRAVRLLQGKYDEVTVYDENAYNRALLWKEEGAEFLHIVDLDGARSGEPVNHALIGRVASELGIPVQVGGGVRTRERAKALLDSGVSRVILGTRLASDFDFVASLVDEFGSEALVAGVDARDGRVATSGWENQTSIDSLELCAKLQELGIRHLVYTDIARDGMMQGIDTELYRSVAEAAGFPVIVSGGITNLQDFADCALLGDEIVEGVISGKALFEGAFSISEARNALERKSNG